MCKTKPITNCGRNSKKWMRIPTSQAMTPGRSLYPRNGFPNLSEDKRARGPPISQPRAKRFQGYRRIPQHPLTTRTSGIVHGAIEESRCLTPPQSDSKPPKSKQQRLHAPARPAGTHTQATNGSARHLQTHVDSMFLPVSLGQKRRQVTSCSLPNECWCPLAASGLCV